MSNVFNENSYAKTMMTTIKAAFAEEGQNCIQLIDSVFYPQGGGQKGDKGTLSVGGRVFHVINTVKDPFSESGGVLLIVQEDVDEGLTGQNVECQLDWPFRYRQMRLHSAVHLHHCMMEKVAGRSLPHPKTSDIQDGFAFNRYDSAEISPDLVQKASDEFRKFVSDGNPISTYPDPAKPGFRWWECAGYKIPCGGTHVRNISEVNGVEIAYSTKKGMPTVTITLNEQDDASVGLS